MRRFEGLGSTAPILGRRHTGRATKRARKTCLGREARIESDLCKRQSACCYFGHRVLDPKPVDITMGRDTERTREHARKMECAESSDPGQLRNRNLFSNIDRNVI